MWSKLAQTVLTLSFATHCLSQNVTVPGDRFYSEIPQEEAAALAEIVEDPAPVIVKRGSGTSPALTLYSTALPIPPVAQVKQYVPNLSCIFRY